MTQSKPRIPEFSPRSLAHSLTLTLTHHDQRSLSLLLSFPHSLARFFCSVRLCFLQDESPTSRLADLQLVLRSKEKHIAQLEDRLLSLEEATAEELFALGQTGATQPVRTPPHPTPPTPPHPALHT